MLTPYFDFQLASYEKLSEVELSEVVQADIIEIREFVKGGIFHSNSMLWMGSLRGVSSAKEVIRSKKERKVIEENRRWFEKEGYSFEILRMNKQLFNEFYDLYQDTTLKRERPIHFSLKDQILGKLFIETPVYLVGMFKKGKLESGLVFSISEENVAQVSFGAKKKFDQRRGGVGGVLELLLIEYCLEHQITEINHGKSKNPAGITGKAGIFEFKARYGFSAFPMGFWKTTFIINPQIALSDLVFVTMIKNQLGYLVVSDSDLAIVQKKYQTREVQQIQRLSMLEAKRMGKRFIRQLKK